MLDQEHISIHPRYLKHSHYEQMMHKSKNRNALYSRYLEMMEMFFLELATFDDHFREVVKEGEKNRYVGQLKSMLEKMGFIIRETAVFQLACLTQSHINNHQQSVCGPYEQILGQLGECERTQIAFQSNIHEIQQFKAELNKSYLQMKNDSNDPLCFFSKKLMGEKCSMMRGKVSELKNLEQLAQETLNKVGENCNEFEEIIHRFRKKLLHNKYKVLASLRTQSKHFKNCLSEIIFYLHNCIEQKFSQFQKVVKSTEPAIQTLSSTKSRKGAQKFEALYIHANKELKDYNQAIQELQLIVKLLKNFIKQLQKKYKQILDGNRTYFVEHLGNLFGKEESPNKQMVDALSLFQFFALKLSSSSEKLYDCETKLTILKTNVKRHADVSISLFKAVYMKKKANGEDGISPQLQQLFAQLSDDYLIQIIMEIYSSLAEAFQELRNHLVEKVPKKKKMLQNSMDVSYLNQTVFIPKKRPCNDELWLWKDWRDKLEPNFEKSETFIVQIEKFLEQFKEIPPSEELKRCQCQFIGKKSRRGLLKICQKSLQFITFSSNSESHITIPYSYITSVDLQVRIFEKVLAIQTEKGDLIFQQISNVEAVKNFISEKVDASNAMDIKVDKKVAVQLLPEQIKCIQQKKARLSSLRPSIDGMVEMSHLFMEGIRIDQVYDIIYSDKQFSLFGKPEPCFFACIAKKTKNFNYVSNKYDQPGPQFYSQQEGVKFNNAPEYSARILEYDHPLTGIPFMPQSCHVREQATIYWLTNEQFDYQSTNYTSGAPYADTMECRVVHRVVQKDGGVDIKLHGGVFFIKETNMKGFLKSPSEKTMIEGSKVSIKEIEKALKIFLDTDSRNGSPAQESSPEQQEEVQEDVSKQAKSKPKSPLNRQHMVVFECILLGFILNALLRYFMG